MLQHTNRRMAICGGNTDYISSNSATILFICFCSSNNRFSMGCHTFLGQQPWGLPAVCWSVHQLRHFQTAPWIQTLFVGFQPLPTGGCDLVFVCCVDENWGFFGGENCPFSTSIQPLLISNQVGFFFFTCCFGWKFTRNSNEAYFKDETGQK